MQSLSERMLLSFDEVFTHFRIDIHAPVVPMISSAFAAILLKEAFEWEDFKRVVDECIVQEHVVGEDAQRWMRAISRYDKMRTEDMERVEYDAAPKLQFIFSHISRLIEEKRYAQAYDFVDAIHFVSEIIIKYNRIEASYRSVYIVTYARRWKDREALEVLKP